MKKYLWIVSVLILGQMDAQTGIGTTVPHASAKLEVNATNKGFLPPRITLTSGTDTTTIPSPATGLLVYNTGNNTGLVAGYYYWSGSSWATIATASGSGVSASYLRGSRSSGQTTGITAGGIVVFTQVDNSAGQDISLNAATGQITLAAGRTYRLTAQVPNFQTANADARPQFGWYNETAGAYFGSSASAYSSASPAGYGASGGVAQGIITTTTTTVISFRILATFNISQIGGSGDFSSTGSYPWFDAEVISGNQPATPERVTKFVNAGTFITLDNLKATVLVANNYAGLSIGAVSTPFNALISGTFAMYGASGGNGYNANQSITTTATDRLFGWGFPTAGDTSTYIITDNTNNRVYRIILQINYSFNNNFMSIERLL